MGVERTRINVSIDELVLHGPDGIDGPRLRQAIQAELTRLMSQGDHPPAPTRDMRLESVDAANETMTDAGPESIGGQVARSIFRGLSR